MSSQKIDCETAANESSKVCCNCHLTITIPGVLVYATGFGWPRFLQSPSKSLVSSGNAAVCYNERKAGDRQKRVVSFAKQRPSVGLLCVASFYLAHAIFCVLRRAVFRWPPPVRSAHHVFSRCVDFQESSSHSVGAVLLCHRYRATGKSQAQCQ